MLWIRSVWLRKPTNHRTRVFKILEAYFRPSSQVGFLIRSALYNVHLCRAGRIRNYCMSLYVLPFFGQGVPLT